MICCLSYLPYSTCMVHTGKPAQNSYGRDKLRVIYIKYDSIILTLETNRLKNYESDSRVALNT